MKTSPDRGRRCDGSHRSAGVGLLLAVVTLALPASGSITVKSPVVTLLQITGSEDLSEGGTYESGAESGAETVYAFDEGQDIAVAGFDIDLTTSSLVGGWTAGQPTSPSQITGNVSSHYLHFDTADASTITRSGFVEFDAPILGVITTTSRLDGSDAAVGSGGITFSPGRQLGSPDYLRVEGGDRRLVFSFQNVAGTDQVRVITGTAASGGGAAVTEIMLSGGEIFVEGAAFEGDGFGGNTVYFFAEQQGLPIDGLEVDLDTARLQTGWTAGQALEPVPLTERVDSFYLFFDSFIDAESTSISASVTLPRPVLGVIISNGRLVTSDALLAVPGVTFGGTRNLGPPGDALSLDASGRVLSFTLENLGATDDVRIVVESAEEVPALRPAGALVLGALLVAVAASRLARRHAGVG